MALGGFEDGIDTYGLYEEEVPPLSADCTGVESHRGRWVKKCKACSSFERTEQLGSVTKPRRNKTKITFEACEEKQ